MKKKHIYPFLTLLFAFLAGCSKDEPAVGPETDSPEPPIENPSSYVPIDWEKTKITEMHPESGIFTLSFSGNEIPVFDEKYSLVVLQTDTSAYLRRVMNAQTDGNTVKLQTIEATMQELFSNTEFTLSAGDPSETKSTQGNVYAPSKVIRINEDGSGQVLYDENSKTKGGNDRDISIPILPILDLDLKDFNIEQEFGDITDVSVSAEEFRLFLKYAFDLYFKFGPAVNEKEIDENFKIPVSKLNECRLTYAGKMISNTKVQFTVSRNFKKDGEFKIPITLYRYIFVYMIGYIPVWVELNVDPFTSYEVGFGGSVTATIGYNLSGNFEIGCEYESGSSVKPVKSANYSFEAMPFEVGLDGSYIYGKMATRCRISSLLYSTTGPTISIIPFVENKYYTGLPFPDYMSWSNEIDGGIEFQMGVMAKFLGMEKELEFRPLFGLSTNIYKSPKRIRLTAPANHSDVKFNEPVKVLFSVTGEWTIPLLEPTEIAQKGAMVQFKSNNMKLDKKIVLTDEKGLAEVKWTPTEANDSLVATILDHDGKELDRAVFKPKETGEGSGAEKFSIAGIWEGESTMAAGDATLTMKEILTLNENGTYNYVYNPEKKVLETTHPHTIWGLVPWRIYSYAYSYGYYKYDTKTSLLTLNPEKAEHDWFNIIGDEPEGGEMDPPELTKKGTFEVEIESATNIYIENGGRFYKMD